MRIILLGLALFIFSFSDAYAQKRTDQEKIEYEINRIGMKTYLPTFEKIVLKLTDKPEIALPLLIDIIKDEDTEEHSMINAVYIIGRMHENGVKALVPLTKILSSRKNSANLKAVAAGALSRMGKKAAPAVPMLKNNLYHKDSWVRSQATRALKSIGTKKARAALKEYADYQKELKFKALYGSAEGGGASEDAEK